MEWEEVDCQMKKMKSSKIFAAGLASWEEGEYRKWLGV